MGRGYLYFEDVVGLTLFIREVAKTLTAGLSPVSGLSGDFPAQPPTGLEAAVGVVQTLQ